MDPKQISELTCRVCLNVDELMVNIYEEVEDLQSNLVELLETCGGLTVNRTDNLPEFLCKVCASELLVAAKFREKCSKSNEFFGQMVVTDVFIAQGNVAEGNQMEVMTDEVWNEIIVEELEEKDQQKSEAKDVTYLHNCLIVDDDGQELSPTNGVEDIIVSDHEQMNYVVQTIETTNARGRTKKQLQKAAPLNFDCDACGAAFSYVDNLSRHLRTHQEFMGKLHTCPICFHTFTKPESLQTHLRSNHTNDGLHTPVVACVKKKRLRKEVCQTCGKVCVSEASLKVHIRTHTGDRPYLCTECPKAFKTQAALSLHLKRHAGQLDWECDVCGKAFVESSNLRVHMRTHTGEKPHLCKMCGRKFSRVFLLQLHLRTHTGEKPYKCDTCNKAYSQKCDLDIHVRSHTGVRPYVCPICFKGFVKRYTLQKHVRQHS